MSSRLGAWWASVLLALPVLAAGMVSQTFDPLQTSASFKVGMRLPLRVEGRFESAQGELEGAAPGRMRVHVRLDGRALRMTGSDWMRRVTLSADFLDVQQHPEIHFDSAEFEPGLLVAGGPLRGRLQLRGQAREVTFRLLPATCARPGHDCAIEVRGELDRHDFGMNAHRFTVRDDISFEFSIRLAAALP